MCFLSIVCLIFILPLKAQENDQKDTLYALNFLSHPQLAQENPLFVDESLLKFTITMDVRAVLKDRGEESSYHPAVISYNDNAGTEVNEVLKLRVRGNRRRDPTVCKFPPLLLNFRRSTVENTIFGKVNKVKMVTHCLNDDYVLREYLIYKLYNIITDKSFRVRLCLITYKDSEGKKDSENYYAFLIEDDDIMAERNGGTMVSEKLMFRMDRTEPLSMAKLAMFQYMIGNTDWSVPYRHNIEMISVGSDFIAVPFDFDYCGMVNTPYAQPPPELGISSVRQRLFRGYRFTDEIYSEVIKYFNTHKREIYGVYLTNEMLDKSSKKTSVKYLDSFYQVLNNKKKFNREIIRAGESNQKHIISIKGLE
jgi:hypothetical protein